jgi:hypothetical protein
MNQWVVDAATVFLAAALWTAVLTIGLRALWRGSKLLARVICRRRTATNERDWCVRAAGMIETLAAQQFEHLTVVAEVKTLGFDKTTIFTTKGFYQVNVTWHVDLVCGCEVSRDDVLEYGQDIGEYVSTTGNWVVAAVNVLIARHAGKLEGDGVDVSVN